MSETGAPPRIILIVAAGLATVFAVTVTVLSLVVSPGDDSADEPGGNADPPGPLPLVSIPAPQADSAECTDLLQAAPKELESSGEQLARRELAEPAPAATLAWGQDNPVILRCGLERPPELTQTSSLREIDGVQWLYVEGPGTATWYAVDRPVYAALTVPDTAGTGPLQQISESLTEALPAEPVFE